MDQSFKIAEQHWARTSRVTRPCVMDGQKYIWGQCVMVKQDLITRVVALSMQHLPAPRAFQCSLRDPTHPFFGECAVAGSARPDRCQPKRNNNSLAVIEYREYKCLFYSPPKESFT